MTKSKFNCKSKCLKLCALLLFPSALFGGLALSKTALDEKASVLASGYAESYSESVNVENPSFANGNRPYASGTTLSGWSPIESASKATGMLIDVGSGEASEGGSAETTTFTKYKDTYMLTENPECKDSKDTRILMINSKANSNQNHVSARKGYRSSTISLAANSYYSFKVSVRTMLNGDDYAKASLYVAGLKDLKGQEFKIGVENVSPRNWTDYYIFVATGNESQSVTLDLYLGSASGEKSQGAVFFDDCNVERYSENLFYSLIQSHGYSFVDNADSFENNKVFLVQGLKTLANYIDSHDEYNFDFETDNTLNQTDDAWKEIGKVNGHAQIMNIADMQPSAFKETTGFNFTGNDFSYNNKNSLVMWTGTKSGYSTSYVGVKSKDIQIEAHTAYKVSLKLKIAGMNEGSFTLKVTENESIYSLYPSVFSKDEDAKNYFKLQSAETSGFSANTDNDWTNDYQTVEFFIKGYDLYNSSVNLELWLGNKSTNSNGCVIIDNIEVEKVESSKFNNATNKLELKAYSGSTSGFTNPLFNATEHSGEDLAFPLSATGWESKIENEKFNESGVIYLGKDDEYKTMYAGKYDWAGISPAKSGQLTDNVYMMFNRQNSYQSLKSSSYSIGSDTYYKISFEYYNQLFSTLNPSSIKVELVDENGITLFSQDGLSSLDSWETMEIYLHTAKMVSHKINVVIHFGEENNKVGGIVYLDNFKIDTSTKEDFAKGLHNVDFADYFLSLETNGVISNQLSQSPAFDFTVDEIFDKGYQGSLDGAEGGIINGQNNPYGITTEKSNFLVLSSNIASKSSLTSKYKFAFDTGSYYKLTFDLATMFNESLINENTDHDCNYGVSIKMNGFDAIEGLTTGGELKSYTIFIKCDTTTTDSKFVFTLNADCTDALGTALLTNFNIEKSTNDEFTSASTLASFNDTTFTANQAEVVEDTPEDDDNETEERNDNAWLLIPSIIMGLALIVAIVGLLLKKVKIKKIQKIKKETYDRKLTLNHDVVAAEAKKRRDKEVADLQNARNMLKQDRANLEEEHKQFVKSSRENSNGKLTREMEKAFKKYNANIARIDEKINIIKEKIDNVMTAEYLLEIEHKIALEEEAKFNANKKNRE